MKMSLLALPLSAVVLAMSLTACGSAPDAPASDPDSASKSEPITLHARLDYRSDWASSGIGERHFETSLDMEAPAFREGSGRTASYSDDSSGNVRVRGWMRGAGSANVVSDEATLVERYDKSASWPQLQVVDGALFAVLPPDLSAIGEGLHTQLKLHAPLKGESSAHASGPSGSADVAPQFAVPAECSTNERELNAEGCGVNLDIDAAPTRARRPSDETLLTSTRDALAQKDSAWGLALLGNHYGATTEYRPGGHFVQRLASRYDLEKDGNRSHVTLSVVVWSTGRGERWEPKDLAPVRARP